MIFWGFTIHKAQGKTLDHEVVYLSKSYKYCGVTLVTLYDVHESKYFLMKPCYLENLLKVKLFQFTTFDIIGYSIIKY